MGIFANARNALAFALTGAQLSIDAAIGDRNPESPWADGSGLSTHMLEDLYGLARSITVTRKKAISLDVVAKGRRIYAGQISRMTLRNVKYGKPAPTQMSLLAQPEQGRSCASTLIWTADQLYFHGRTWWIVQQRDSYGWPMWVRRLDRKDAKFDMTGTLIEAHGQPVQPRDVIEFDHIDGGLLNDAADMVRRGLIINAAAALAEDNPVPALDLHNEGEELSPNQIEELLTSWQNARRKRGVGYSSKGLKVNALGAPTTQLLLDGRKAIDLALARHVGLPAWALDVALEGSTLSYENRASRNWELLDLGLSPMMTSITSRLSMGDVTPHGWQVEFNTDQLTRDDMKTRFETYKIGVDGNFVTPEQIAAWEGWEGITR